MSKDKTPENRLESHRYSIRETYEVISEHDRSTMFDPTRLFYHGLTYGEMMMVQGIIHKHSEARDRELLQLGIDLAKKLGYEEDMDVLESHLEKPA